MTIHHKTHSKSEVSNPYLAHTHNTHAAVFLEVSLFLSKHSQTIYVDTISVLWNLICNIVSFAPSMQMAVSHCLTIFNLAFFVSPEKEEG